MKQATFYLEKIIRDGKECVEILGWKNVLKYSDLPKEYFDTVPYFYAGAKGEVVMYFESHWTDIYIGTYMRKEHWEKLEEYMKQAGSRLSAILKKKRWHGKFKVEI